MITLTNNKEDLRFLKELSICCFVILLVDIFSIPYLSYLYVLVTLVIIRLAVTRLPITSQRLGGRRGLHCRSDGRRTPKIRTNCRASHALACAKPLLSHLSGVLLITCGMAIGHQSQVSSKVVGIGKAFNIFNLCQKSNACN